MESSALSRLAGGLRRSLIQRLSDSLLPSPVIRHYCTATEAPRPTLASVINPLGHPCNSMATELDRWVENGNHTRGGELRHIVRDLRNRRRFKHALEVSEWMQEKGNINFMPGDHAIRLYLIGRVHGLAAAENYFKSLDKKNKTEKAYGALLNCYVTESKIQKAFSLLRKMKDLGFASSVLTYNNIMCLYTHTCQHEKVPSVLAEMKENGVQPDIYSYRICINSYGARLDVDGMEKIFEEMKSQPLLEIDWHTYSLVANMYIKAGQREKAISMLVQSEEKLDKRNSLCYNHLISLYASLEMKSEMLRIWELQKSYIPKPGNRNYKTMIAKMARFGELEEAEKLFKEWKDSGNAFDFEIPNSIIGGYCRKGLLEKAQELFDYYVKQGREPLSSTWGILATGYANKGDMSKAYEYMVNALRKYVPMGRTKLKGDVVDSILQWLSNEGDANAVESFVDLLKKARRMNRAMYHALLKANVRAGKDVDELLECMKKRGIEKDEETEEILKLKV